MTENDVKGKETPAVENPSSENKPESPKDNGGDNQPKSTEELGAEKTKLEGEVSNLQIAQGQETEKLRKLREDRQGLEKNPEPADPTPDPSLNDTPDEIDEKINKAVNERLAERDGNSLKANKEKALRIFQEKHPEYKSENDIGNTKFDPLNDTARELIKAGMSTDEILGKLEFTHRGLYPNKPDTDGSDIEVADPGIGVTDSIPRQKQPPKEGEVTIERLKQQANEHDKKAAAHYPGGEEKYWEKRLESENKRQEE